MNHQSPGIKEREGLQCRPPFPYSPLHQFLYPGVLDMSMRTIDDEKDISGYGYYGCHNNRLEKRCLQAEGTVHVFGPNIPLQEFI